MTFFRSDTERPHAHLVLRLTMDMLLLLAALAGPWWLTCILGALLIIILHAYEAVVGAFVFDSIHASSVSLLPVGEFVLTIFFLVLTSAVWSLAQHARRSARI